MCCIIMERHTNEVPVVFALGSYGHFSNVNVVCRKRPYHFKLRSQTKHQWRIQDFPESGRNSKVVVLTYYFANFLAKSA